jgi:predicted transcriptional regulator
MTSDNDEPAPNEQYPDEAFLEAIEEGYQGTREIADAVGCNRRTADHRLRKLEDEGVVTSEKIVRSLVWSIDGD